MEDIIDQAIREAAEGTLDFPGYVKLLETAGVDCYTVDLSTHKMVFYAGTKNVTKRFPPQELDIAPRFSEDRIREAIMAVQKKRIDYPEFLKRIAAAGVETYEASFKLKNVTYRGRRKSYIEPFVL
jgi:uncharacterized protein YbcV (DUF1398 family)